MPLLSMTGFGRAEASLGGRRFGLELRAVNHRYLDVRVRLPSELSDLVGAVDAVAKARLGRGRIEATGRLGAGDGGARSLDRERAREVFRELVEVRDELAPDAPVPLSLLAAVPEIFGGPEAIDVDVAQEVVTRVAREACDDLQAMREREGEALGKDLRERLATIRAHLRTIDRERDALVAAQRGRLKKRLDRLLADTQVTLEAGRLEQEVAILADRADVEEELTRLASHLDQFDAFMLATEAQVGRKLDFLVQEMNREVNTIGSKSADADLTHTVVAMKAELERVREQVQNVL